MPWVPVTRMGADPSMSCCVFAIAESPLEKGQIWTGSNDGLLYLTRDGGKNWLNVTKNIPDFPPKGKITNIEPSRYDAAVCYFSADLHEMNHWKTYIYKTADYGRTWKWLGSGIPRGFLSYAHCIREDPVKKGLLYLGTENMLYVSFDDGKNWAPLQTGMPHAPVHWLVVQEHFNDLVVGTYGRGFYIMDDITPLQQLTPEALKAGVFFFKPRPAYRLLAVEGQDTNPNDQCAGKNPPYGAIINYYLKETPKGGVTIDIFDETGEKVNSLKGSKNSGINRLAWNLCYEIKQRPKLRTAPLGAPHVRLGKQGWRPLRTWGGPIYVWVKPGVYTLKLKVDGKEYEQKLTVKKDPKSAGTLEDIKVQTRLLLEIRKNQDDLISMINRIEWLRKQLLDLNSLLSEDKEKNKDLIAACKAMEKKFLELEGKLFQVRLTGAGQDTLRWPAKLYLKFSSLGYEISKADFPPTDQQVELHKVLKDRLSGYQKSFKELLDKDLPGFNGLLKTGSVPHIMLIGGE